jgi:hypothetical protein
MRTQQRRERRNKHRARHRGVSRHTDDARELALGAGHEIGEDLGLELILGHAVLQQAGAGLRQLYSRRPAREECQAQLVLEVADALGESGLREVQLFGGAGEVQRARHRGEGFEL